MTTRQGFKFVAADLTTRNHEYSYLQALQTGQPVVEPDATEHDNPCPKKPGDGLCVALTVAAASSGGQAASTAVGLLVEFDQADVLAEGGGKVRVRALRVTGVFDPSHLIRLGMCANLRGANLGGADLRYADLRDANLYGAELRRANLRYAVLRDANLEGADLRDAVLRDANLYGADLRDADLRDANLYGADLWGTDLRGTDLRDADLRRANLRYADLRGTDLRGTDLRGTDLRGTDLRGTDLRGTDLPEGHKSPKETSR